MMALRWTGVARRRVMHAMPLLPQVPLFSHAISVA